MVVSLWRNLQHLLAGKKSASSFTFFLTYLLRRYYKPVVFGTLSIPGYAHITETPSSCRKLMFICRQKINFIPHAFMEILQRYETYFGYFGHAWLHSPIIIVSPCTRLQCLSACKKQTSSFTSFVRYYSLENPTNWLVDSILDHNPRSRILPDMVVKYQ